LPHWTQNFGAEVTAVGLRVRPRPSRRGRCDRHPDLLGNGGERAGGGALRCPRHEGLAAIRRGGERGVEGHAAEERDAGVAGEQGGAEADGSSRSIDITLTPSDVRGGSTPPDAKTRRWPRTPSIFAIVGPLRSASRTPTRKPPSARQQARFAVSDDLPTPPLPETIATTAWTAARRSLSLAC